MFKPGNNLEEAILRSFSDASYTPQFYRELLDSEIMFLIAGDNLGTPKIHYQPGANVKILRIEFEGISWLPVFSSLKFLQEFTKSNCNYGKLMARDFFMGIPDTYVILNPNLEKSWRFTPKMIHDLVDGSFFQPQTTITIKKPTTVQVREPAAPPQELTKALSELFKRNKNIRAAYLVEYYNPENNESPHPLIGIETDSEYEEIMGDAGLVTSRIVQNKYLVDFTQLKIGDSGVKGYMLEKIKPFYKKKMFGGIF